VIYWTIAVVYLVLSDGSALMVQMPFKDEMACGQALPLLVDAARIDHPESWGQCHRTNAPSGVTVRPQARGE
jgi:hypothetical protein